MISVTGRYNSGPIRPSAWQRCSAVSMANPSNTGSPKRVGTANSGGAVSETDDGVPLAMPVDESPENKQPPSTARAATAGQPSPTSRSPAGNATPNIVVGIDLGTPIR